MLNCCAVQLFFARLRNLFSTLLFFTESLEARFQTAFFGQEKAISSRQDVDIVLNLYSN
jgi:hypothetical protein